MSAESTDPNGTFQSEQKSQGFLSVGESCLAEMGSFKHVLVLCL